jgi:ribosomal-protein-alanine N-acetyltransferase
VTDRDLVTTDRLELPPATVEELDALIARKRERFEALIGASAPVPMVAPPETGDVVEWFRGAIANDPSIRPWFFRWIIDRHERRLVGSVGFAGHPDEVGIVLLGYSVYPADQGKGYATEAAARMVAWAFAHEQVKRVRATIRPGHIASERVAAKAGLNLVGEVETEEDGVVELWEVVRPHE